MGLVGTNPFGQTTLSSQFLRSARPNRLGFRFSGGQVLLRTLWNGTLALPYPVPFDLLEKLRPGQTKGWFATTYLDERLRISRGNKGSVFVLKRPAGYWEKEGARG